MNFAPLSRIVLRYSIGYFGAKGILPTEVLQMLSEDPEVMVWIENGIAVACGALVEYWYSLAVKYGWSK